jgi:glycosyltransferase involved in cell wall biosynthesis
VLVNDGSPDRSWDVIREKALTNKNIVAINLLKNYGQHNANICGLRHSTGDYVLTIDDDLQNPPEEMIHLIRAAQQGYDCVFGKFDIKQASFTRSIGSRAIGMINRRIFGQPKDLVVSNFRIMRRDVVDRICTSRSAFPYITGLALLNSRDRANVTVRHEPRKIGKSNYSLTRIARLVMTILFSYSSFPLRLSAAAGFIIASFSFLIGGTYLVVGLFRDASVPGWTSVVVLLSFLNGVTILMLSMLGEYVVRTLNQVSNTEPYHVVDVVAVGR